MPLKLNLGISKKIGQRDYGSLGASCHVELELDQSLIFEDLDGFQSRVKHAYAACQQAVRDELARQQESQNGQTASQQPARANGSAHTSDSPNGHHEHNGHREHAGHRASQKQLDYAGQLAGQIRGMGVRRLETLANKMFNKPLADLSTLDASGLIDVLKEIKAGKIRLAAALSGEAA